jgi:O-antigen ligase
MTAILESARTRLDYLFRQGYSTSFALILILLFFNSFRPDKLIPGGKLLLYVPTLIIFILACIWVTQRGKVISNTQTKLFLGFIVVASVGVLLARNMAWAFLQFKSLFLYSFIPYLLMIQFLDTTFKIDKYLKLYLIFGIFFGTLGVIYKASLPISVLRDENDFALFMNILIPFGFFIGQLSYGFKNKLFYYSTVFIFVLANVSSFSRGGLLGLSAVGAFIFSNSRNKIAALLVLILALVCMFAYAPDQYWAKIEKITTEGAAGGTGKERIVSWIAGTRMFMDNPIIGVGPMNFGMWFPEYYEQYTSISAANMWGRVAHSLYFTLIAETGALGTIIFMAMVWYNFSNLRYVIKLNKKIHYLVKQAVLDDKDSHKIISEIDRLHFYALACLGALIAFLVTGTFISVLWYGYFWMLTSFVVCIANAANKIDRFLIASAASHEEEKQEHNESVT